MTALPLINLAAGVPQYLVVLVTSNAVQPDGSNPGVLDTVTPLSFQPAQGFGTVVTASEVAQTSEGKRVVKITPLTSVVGGGAPSFAFVISAAGKLATLAVNGTAASPPNVSGVSYDGTPLSTVQPT